MTLRVWGDGENNRAFEIVVDKQGLKALSDWLELINKNYDGGEQRYTFFRYDRDSNH